MHLLDLPSELISLVLKLSLCRPPDSRQAFKANLPLLAICSAIRQLSLPLVYQLLFFSYEPMLASGSDVANASSDHQFSARVDTNLGLVLAAGGIHIVREVFIWTRFVETPSPAFWEIIGRMGAVAPEWSRVRSLKMFATPTNMAVGLPEIEMDNDTPEMLAVGDALAELMPGLQQLEGGGMNRHLLMGEMCGRVAGRFADQLLKVMFRGPLRPPTGSRLGVVRDLRLCSSVGTVWQPPRISADALERLELTGFSNDDLYSFIDTNSSSNNRTIVFPKLKVLKIMQPSGQSTGRVAVDGRPYQQCLRLLALKRLEISCHNEECPLWKIAMLPGQMDSLTLVVTGATCESIAKTTLPKARRLHLKVIRWGPDIARTNDAINCILAGAGGHESKELVDISGWARLHPGSIACNDLTMLELSGPTSVDELLGFLRTQPRLCCLSLKEVTIGDIHADISVPGSDEDQLAVPLHANLSKLAIKMAYDHGRKEQVVAVAKRLLLGLPELATFKASGVPKPQIVNFVREYAHRYAHLAGIKLELFG